MHASCLTFPVSILSRIAVVSHPFFRKTGTLFHVSRRTSEFTVTTFGPDTTSSEAHWTFRATRQLYISAGGWFREGSE